MTSMNELKQKSSLASLNRSGVLRKQVVLECYITLD